MAKGKTYRTSVYIGLVNGKQVTKTVRAGSKAELKRKVAEIKKDLQGGKDVLSRAYFGDWAEKWYQTYKAPMNLSPSTLSMIQRELEHLNSYFRDVQLKDISLNDFQKMINDLATNNPKTGRPMSVKMLGNIKSTSQAIFNYAAANKIAGVPMFFSSVIIPKDKAIENPRRALTEEEQRWIIETEHRRQLPAMIMLFSGLRRGECLALEWSDIDLENSLIYVNKTLVFSESDSTLKQGGKTESATRTVPIPPILRDYLAEYKRGLKTITKLVCTNTRGKPYAKGAWKTLWQSYMLELNLKYGYKSDIKKHDNSLKASDLPLKIEPFTPHYLRHTFATMLYLQDVDAVKAKEILGHSDIQTTINIYTDFKTLNRNKISPEYKSLLQTSYQIKIA